MIDIDIELLGINLSFTSDIELPILLDSLINSGLPCASILQKDDCIYARITTNNPKSLDSIESTLLSLKQSNFKLGRIKISYII